MIKKTNDPVIDRILVDLQQQIDLLKKSVNQPMQKDGSFFNGKNGDIRFVKGSDKKGYLEVKTEDGVYTTVSDIFKILEKERPYPYFEELWVDNLTAKVFTYKQLVGTNGDYIISDSAEVESAWDREIYFKDLSNLDVCPFAVGDLIQCLRVNASTGVEIKNIKATVQSVFGRKIWVTYNSTDRAAKGDVFVRVGNTTTASRKNIIFLSTTNTNAPFIDLYTNIGSFTTYGTILGTTPKVRIGNLSGITDITFGSLNGFGLYAENVFLKGKLQISSNADIIGLVIPSATYTSGNTFPQNPNEGDWHFYTGTQPGSGQAINSWHRYSGSAWVQLGLQGTYIDGTGIYTGTIVADQIIAGTLTGFTIQTAASPNTRLVLSGTSLSFYYGNTLVGVLSPAAGSPYGISSSVSFYAPSFYASDGTIASQYWVNSQGFLTSETDPTIYAWAKAATKPSYTYSEVGAAASSHNHQIGEISVPGIGYCSGTTIYYKDHSGNNQQLNVITF